MNYQRICIPRGWPPYAQWKNFKIPVFIAFVLVTILTAFALKYFTWSGLVIAILLYCISGQGITMGHHRYFTHRSFKTTKWFKYTLAMCGSAALQGGLLDWVSDHRWHHKETEVVNIDVHTTRNGVMWAHAGWHLFRDSANKEPMKMVPDLLKDPVLVLISQWFWVTTLVLAVALYYSGTFLFDPFTGESWVVWGIGVRIFFLFNWTWAINSICHWLGRKDHDTGDDSTNNRLVAIFTFGEGNHNDHHDDETCAAHGKKLLDFDSTYWLILLLEKIGIVWDVKKPKPIKI